jgi:hypothetical protein
MQQGGKTQIEITKLTTKDNYNTWIKKSTKYNINTWYRIIAEFAFLNFNVILRTKLKLPKVGLGRRPRAKTTCSFGGWEDKTPCPPEWPLSWFGQEEEKGKKRWRECAHIGRTGISRCHSATLYVQLLHMVDSSITSIITLWELPTATDKHKSPFLQS